nr:hypothetical protein [uncultured bacterium]AMP54353.1 hypothetical protein [uncultured bacterium]AMP54433.1 hypothetical protein [uncultured bacterium]
MDFTNSENDSTIDIHYQQYKQNGEKYPRPVSISIFSEYGTCNPVFLDKEDCREIGEFLIEISQGMFES